MHEFKIDPKLDLVLERTIDVPRARVWQAWTIPEQLMRWYCPKPWRTTACEIDLRPGGRFDTVMEGPDGERHDNRGCYLEVIAERTLVWTDALTAGYRPAAAPFMTGMLLLEDAGAGTKYTAMALHHDAATMQKHEKMGFHDGWAAALAQLVAMIKSR